MNPIEIDYFYRYCRNLLFNSCNDVYSLRPILTAFEVFEKYPSLTVFEHIILRIHKLY